MLFLPLEVARQEAQVIEEDVRDDLSFAAADYRGTIEDIERDHEQERYYARVAYEQAVETIWTGYHTKLEEEDLGWMVNV